MIFDPEKIPRPVTEADYAACYRANLEEARGNLERAQERFRALVRAGTITENADDRKLGKWRFADANAAKAYGDVVRWQSDLNHWHTRMTQAERAAAMQAPDPRLPPEPEPADDGEVPF